MKIYYDSEQDQLRITLTSERNMESEEVAEGLVFDYDKQGGVVAIEIEHAVARMHLPAVARRDLLRALVEASGRVEVAK
jgi:uncharacterized protein YuzE